MVYKYGEAQSNLNPMLIKILEVCTKTLDKATVNYFQYYDALIGGMLNKTFQYDFKSALSLFETIGLLAFHLLKEGKLEESAKL